MVSSIYPPERSRMVQTFSSVYKAFSCSQEIRCTIHKGQTGRDREREWEKNMSHFVKAVLFSTEFEAYKNKCVFIQPLRRILIYYIGFSFRCSDSESFCSLALVLSNSFPFVQCVMFAVICCSNLYEYVPATHVRLIANKHNFCAKSEY